MLYLSHTINPLPFLTGHYLPLALVCQQWRAFLKQQNEDYITYCSVKFQSLKMFERFDMNNSHLLFFEELAMNRYSELYQYKSDITNFASLTNVILMGLLKCYIERDDLESVVQILENCTIYRHTKVVKFLTLRNQVHLIKKFNLEFYGMLYAGIENGNYFEYIKLVDPTIEVVIRAANAGKIDIMQHAMRFVDAPREVCRPFIACDDTLEAMQVLHDAGFSFNYFVWLQAARMGIINVLELGFRYGEICSSLKRVILQIFIKSGDLKNVIWMGSRDGLPRHFMYQGENTAIFDYLLLNDCRWDKSNLYAAISSNNMILYRWMMERGCSISNSDWSNMYNPEFVKDNFPKNKEIPRHMVHKAIDHGDLNYLKWLVGRGYVPDNQDYITATISDQLHILVWLDMKYNIKNNMLSILFREIYKNPTDEPPDYAERVLKWVLGVPAYKMGS